jgi:CHAT domain-containing protein
MVAKYGKYVGIILSAALLVLCRISTPTETNSQHDWMTARGDSLRRAGDYASALESYYTAMSFFQLVKNPRGEADASRSIGSVYYYQGDYDGAMEYWEKARQIYQDVGDRKGEGKILNNIGQVSSDLSNFDEAIEYFDQSLAIARELNDLREEGIASQNLGNVYLKRAEYPKALTNYQQSLRIFREIGARELEMINLSTIGSVFLYLCDYAKALDYYQNSYLIAKELGDPRQEAGELNNLGLVYVNLGKYDQSMSCYQQSLALCREFGYLNVEGDVLNNIGTAYCDMADYQNALKYCIMSLSVFRDSGDQIGICSNVLNIGRIYTDLGNYSEALDSISAALEIAKEIGSDHCIQSAYQALGDCYLAQNNVPQAQSSYAQAIAIVEGIRGKLNMEAQKNSYASGVFSIYENMVTLLFNDHQYVEAFNYVERARARSFLDILGGEAQVGKSLKFEISGDTSSAGYEPELRSANSRQPLTLPEVQGLLDPETTLLEYFLAKNNVMIWVLTQASVGEVEVHLPADSLRSLVEGFRETIQWRGSTDYLSIVLHRALIEPVINQMATEKLVIVPHGILHYLPFQALRDQAGTYLFERYQISYSPSASVLKFLPHIQSDKINRVLALGNPASDREEYTSIEFSKNEVERIGKVFPNSEIYQDSLASESVLRKRAGECDIIHLACHAELNSSYPMYSGLVLAPGGGCDGELNVHEIFSLVLHAQLVVLSGCQTGLGQLTTGDELVGLSRAFICAGAQSLLSSLWAVNDESTGYFMECFYRNLPDHNRSEALQIAERDTKEKYSDIYDWAPFVLIGAMN